MKEKEIKTKEIKTLRDEFAIASITKAINYNPAGFIQWVKWFFGKDYNAPTVKPKALAKASYKIADAMLIERCK